MKITLLLLLVLLGGCVGNLANQDERDEPPLNRGWTPVEQEFDGVPMMRVPPGCFMMGSNTGAEDERPVHEQCIDAPFWIDKTEVTQAQFARFGGVAALPPVYAGENRPVESISWLEARDFCALRGARLPTEAEWEYAARGVESWVYPWANTWIVSRTTYSRPETQGTARVGLYPAGASWVGALDMSGNVWEWVSTRFAPYPYVLNDEREIAPDLSFSRGVRMVLRGGGWETQSEYLMRLSVRSSSDPGLTSPSWGFRCARDDR